MLIGWYADLGEPYDNAWWASLSTTHGNGNGTLSRIAIHSYLKGGHWQASVRIHSGSLSSVPETKEKNNQGSHFFYAWGMTSEAGSVEIPCTKPNHQPEKKASLFTNSLVRIIGYIRPQIQSTTDLSYDRLFLENACIKAKQTLKANSGDWLSPNRHPFFPFTLDQSLRTL